MSCPNPEFDIPHIISRLLSNRSTSSGPLVTLPELSHLLTIASALFLSSPTLLRLKSPIIIIGPLRASLASLHSIFTTHSHPPHTSYLFIGPFTSASEGRQSLHLFSLLLALKIQFPECIHLLRGATDDGHVQRICSIWDYTKRAFSIRAAKEVIRFGEVLPLAAVVEVGEKAKDIFAVAGGIPRELLVPNGLASLESIQRRLEVPEVGMVTDLLWANLMDELDCKSGDWWGDNYQEGLSVTFGKDVVRRFLEVNPNVGLVVRGGKYGVEEGVEWLEGREIVTLASFVGLNRWDEKMKGCVISVSREGWEVLEVKVENARRLKRGEKTVAPYVRVGG